MLHLYRSRAAVLATIVLVAGCAAPDPREPSAAEPRQAGSSAVYYVNVLESPIHVGPGAQHPVTGAGYRQDLIEVYEVQNGWGRLSQFYDGGVEGLPGRRVARWIRMSALSRDKPADLRQPAIAADPRIEGIPQVGKAGLVQRDVLILHAAARCFLESGRAQRVNFGDKSLHRPGYYYLNLDDQLSNTFFRPEDIPGLEARIEALQ